MRRVLILSDRVEKSPDSALIHDLRVALRRCRSLARGMKEMGCDPGRRAIRRIGRKLFRRLGKLRDVQVMQAWTTRLSREVDPIRRLLLERFASHQPRLLEKTRGAILKFDRKRWKRLIREQESQPAQVTAGGAAARHLALARLEDALCCHVSAMRDGRAKDWHAMRIAIKRFRYTVEGFLPTRHAIWGADLKRIQDLLGDVHDLDVLWATIAKEGKALSAADLGRWRRLIRREQAARLAEYRKKMAGRNSLLRIWSEELRASLAGEPKLTERAIERAREVALALKARAGSLEAA
jgi:CHAD domain-containing protein